MAEIWLHNTRTSRKEVFESAKEGEVGIYTCGPTVYSVQHLGNLRPYLFVDLLRRALLLDGFQVTHVINVTDVGHLTDDADEGDDKMEVAARRTGRRAIEIAREYTRQWVTDRHRLNCLEPTVLCKATDHIADQIALAQKLEKKGFTYQIEDGLYFDTSKFPRYADFGHLDLSGQEGGGRIGGVLGKRHHADFALWKFAMPNISRQQEWDSPWGRGFPGWHLECSAMSSKYLGRSFDIHTGGVDHIKIHHTNEIAQSECAYDLHPWVNVWMHNEFLDFRGEKMSKSQGNVCALQDLIDSGYTPLGYRYFFLQAHYRKQQTYTDEAMAAADRGYRRLRGSVVSLGAEPGPVRKEKIVPIRKRFWSAVRDDLNAPQALAVAIEVARNRELRRGERHTLLAEFDQWLGLDLLEGPLLDSREQDPRIDELVERREEARLAGNWTEADQIRDQLELENVEVMDTPAGPIWRRR